MQEECKGSKKESSANSTRNALQFAVESIIKSTVNTAILVRVEGVESGGEGSFAGKLTCTPLVTQYDGKGQVLEPTQLFDIPYMRYQGGVVAVVCDPVIGDIGLAIFAQQDISLIEDNTVCQPSSFRSYDMADGLYIGGFLNKSPTTWLELTQEGVASLHSTQSIKLEAPQIEVIAGESIKLEASEIEINSENIKIETQNIDVNSLSVNLTSQAINLTSATTSITSNLAINGLTQANGILEVSGDLTASGTSLKTHVHSGVSSGNSTTSIPV